MKKFNTVIKVLGFMFFMNISFIYAETENQDVRILWERELVCDSNSSCNLRGTTLNEKKNNLLILGASIKPESPFEGKLWFSEVDTNRGKETARMILKDISGDLARSIRYSTSDVPVIHKNGDIFALDWFGDGNNIQSIFRTNVKGKSFIIDPVDKETLMTSRQKELSSRGVNILIKKMVLLSDGNFILVGRGQSDDALAMKVGPHGNRIWEKKYDMGKVDIFQDVVSGDDGNFFIAGASTDVKGKFPDSNSAFAYILKCDTKGEIIHKKTMPGNPWLGRSPKICRLNSGEIVMVYDESNNMKSAECKIKAFNSNLELLWEKDSYKFEQDNFLKFFYCVSVVPDGGLVVAFCANKNELEVYQYDNAGNELVSFPVPASIWLGNFDILCKGKQAFVVFQTRPDDGINKIKVIALELK